MNKQQLFAAVGAIGDDLVSRNQSADRPNTHRRRARRGFRIAVASVAACLALTFAALIWIQVDNNRFVASCGGSPGTVVDGTYYFYDLNSGFYAYTPGGEPIRLVSELFHDLEGIRVNGYGTYYTVSGRRDLVVRIHDTGETVTLYRSDRGDYTHTRIHEIYEDTVLFMLYNKDLEYRTLLRLDARTGEVLETLFEKQPYNAYRADIPYPVGERDIALRNDPANPLRHLVEDGEPILWEEHFLTIGDVYGHNHYAGGSLIAGFSRTNEDGSSTKNFVLLRPDGESILVQDAFEVVGGTDDYLFGRPHGADLRTLWSYCIATGEVTLLIEDYRKQEITTDGIHLYATAPWSGQADVYRLDHTEQGTLRALTLIDTIGE